MSIEEFKKIDTSFEESMFYSKVNNVFIKLMTARMINKLDEVKHFISDNLYKNEVNLLESLKNKNLKQMYDELNVKDSKIIDIQVNEDVYTIKVFLQSRYMDYIINLDDGSLVSGNDKARIQKDYILTFNKNKVTKEQGNIRRCPSCGASIDINASGICEYCGTSYNLDNYDWILNKIENS